MLDDVVRVPQKYNLGILVRNRRVSRVSTDIRIDMGHRRFVDQNLAEVAVIKKKH
jgi:hypothetical protein